MTTEPGKQEIIITRVFDAPRDLVFKAYTDPKHLIKWLGPRGFKIELKIFEPKADCGDIYIQNGNKFGFHGVIHEIAAPEGLSKRLNLKVFLKKVMFHSGRLDSKFCLAIRLSLLSSRCFNQLLIVMK